MLEWEDKYSVGVSIIDREHKELIDILNRVIASKQHNGNLKMVLRLLDETLNYACKHFATEEVYMKKFESSEYQLHKCEHIDFAKKTISYQNRVVAGDCHVLDEILEYLQQWLTHHIQETDKKYTECFNINGLT